jgi:non-ribosomal peptide synthetase component E (peptide arylation enzyme)
MVEEPWAFSAQAMAQASAAAGGVPRREPRAEAGPAARPVAHDGGVGHQAPEEIVVLDEMPLTATGKLDRTALKRSAEANLARSGQQEAGGWG